MSTAVVSSSRLGKPAVKKVLLGIAALRALLAVAAVPLAPFLYEEHFLVLVLLRPTKEVFLAGGFLARQGDVSLPLLILAAIPLSIFGVWHFYVLGRAYAREIHENKMPGFAAKIVTPERIKKFEKALDKKGSKLIFLGRLAVLSSASVAAAAGAAKLPANRFFPWDLAGGLVSIAYTVAAGWFLGEAYEQAGPWITVAGIVALIGFGFILGRSLPED